MSDPVKDYCRQKGYADFVIEGGLDYLINAWERTVESVTSGEIQYEYDYLNDMDTRRIISEVLPLAAEPQKGAILERLAIADKKMRSAVIPTKECIWGSESAEEHGWTRKEHWWYFARPRNVEPDWRSF